MDGQQLGATDFIFNHGWLDCEHTQTRIERFEHIFDWSPKVRGYLDEFLTWLGLKRDCSGAETHSTSKDVNTDAPVDRPRQDMDPTAIASFSQFLGQGNTFVLDDWSSVTADEDYSMCTIHISGQYQRAVKTHSIKVERIDDETQESLYSQEVK